MLNTLQQICCCYCAEKYDLMLLCYVILYLLYMYASVFLILKSTPHSESRNKMSYVSCGAIVAVLVFGFCCSLLFQAPVKTGLVADYFARADKSSVPGNSAHSWAFLGHDCEPATGCNPQVDRTWSYWNCKCFVMEGVSTES